MLTQTTISSASRKMIGHGVGDRRPHNDLSEAIEMLGTVKSYGRNEEIYFQGEPTDDLYKVISGTVRTHKILADGRRQIGAFYLSGDMFGLEARDDHAFSAEAIADAKVVVVKRSAIFALAESDNDIARDLWKLTARELQRVQDRLLLLVKTAQERVVGFLLEMADRGYGANEVELPMSRQDIADYLGLTIETISRTLTHLATTAAIEVPTSRRIVLRNRAALSRLNA